MTALIPRTIVGARSVAVERTPQRLDPLGAQSAWMLVPLLGTLAVAYAVFSTFRHAGQFRDLGLDILAIAVLAIAVLVASIRTHPGLAPFGRWSHFSIIAVAVTAACLAYVEGDNAVARARWAEGLACAVRTGDVEMQANGTAGIGLVLMAQGDLAGAERQFAEALVLAERADADWLRSLLLVWSGTLRLVGTDEDLSFYEGVGAGPDLSRVKEALARGL